MKNKLVISAFFLSLTLLGLAALPVHAKTWDFQAWAADITVAPDSTVTVRETQTFNFRGEFSWVTRSLPKTKGILYDQIEVFDSAGQSLDSKDYSVKQTSAEVIITIKFKLEDTQATWIIKYRALNALGDFEDHDELYWNAVSSDRAVPIRYATATVHLPATSETSDLRTRLLVGPTGSTTDSDNIEIIDGSTIKYYSSDIPAYEDLTLVAGWPKGSVEFQTFTKEIPAWQKAWDSFWSWFKWFYFVSPLFLLFWMIRRWRRLGRDPKGRGTIIPQYDSPDGAPPAVVGALMDERADLKDITSTIIDLAVRGFIRIEEEKSPGIFGGKTYTFVSTKAFTGDQTLKKYERLLLERLFAGRSQVSLGTLKNKFYQDIKDIKKELYEEIMRYGYFPANPESVRMKYYIAAFVCAFVGMFTLFIPIFYAAILVIFSRIMPRKTQKGVEAKEWAKGFNLYLKTAERFRVAAMTPETFERFLPYAMIFGVEKQWAHRFSDIYREPPKWFFSNDPISTFSAIAFTSHLSSVMNSSVGQALASSPSSSSGFGGGGFSGGGGGGGGSGAG